MKVSIGKKYLTITPKPKKNVANGIVLLLDRETAIYKPTVSHDLIKGKSRYLLPDRKFLEGRKIVEAHVKDYA